jgi:ribosome biogenesis GTPase
MKNTSISMRELGWNSFFQQQLSLEELENTIPVRVFALNRHLFEGRGEHGHLQFSLPHIWIRRAVEDLPTVGDWLLIDRSNLPVRLLERTSLFKRMAPGRKARVQLLGANVDTLFIVTSCNLDFNLSRLERYLAMALEAGVKPVLILTKADLVENVNDFCVQARTLRPDLEVEAINSRDTKVIDILRPWCTTGQTVALVGSSGVGKSTLVNTLSSSTVQETGAIREDDSKGRHTTIGRSLHVLPGGGLLLDSPGLRELQLSECEDGVSTLFEEVEAFAGNCRFSNCQHRGEADCGVAEAIKRRELDPRRLANYFRLRAEQEQTAEEIEEKNRREKRLGTSKKRAKSRNSRKKN